MPDYKDLEVYQKSMELSAETWNVVRVWTHFHKDTLGKQMVRSADSIPSNVAEGYGRYSFKERIRFCHIARGSLYEYKTQLQIGRARGLIGDDAYEMLGGLADSLGRLLNGYIRHLRRKQVSRDQGPDHRFTVQEDHAGYGAKSRISPTSQVPRPTSPNTEYPDCRQPSATEYTWGGSPIPNTQSPIPNAQSPVTNHPINHQSPITSHQYPIPQLKARTSVPIP